MPKIHTVEQYMHATAQAAPATLPGVGVLVIDWLGYVNQAASTGLIFLSAAFLVWRWRVAWKKENVGVK